MMGFNFHWIYLLIFMCLINRHFLLHTNNVTPRCESVDTNYEYKVWVQVEIIVLVGCAEGRPLVLLLEINIESLLNKLTPKTSAL